ncbi:MAG: gamma-glutamyl-gamma-aminobutyrate hydrolase family protein [Rhodobacteraceae bacterium]|nr:gamma-glutamyl-gamma-aminobutyrate hydrolase family protein [Paracoccaceae bacterium]
MPRPVIGIIGNSFLVNDEYPAHAVGHGNSRAVAEVAGAMPVLIPSDPDLVTTDDLLDRFDGFVFPGGRANVHPEEYGEQETPAHGTFDRGRDRVALPLIRAAIERGQPVFGICRGFQEFNVALGGTLHPEIRDLPGRMNHRMPPDGTLDQKFALRHVVRVEKRGLFSRLFGAEEVLTNTLHGQGIMRAGAGIEVEGFAPDDTPEALHVTGARGFAMAVQWHPEWRAAHDPVSRPLFEAFGAAAQDWSERPRMRRAV